MTMNLIPAGSFGCETLHIVECKAAQASGQEGHQYRTESSLWNQEGGQSETVYLQ